MDTKRKRNYKREYEQFHGKPEQIKKRAQRVQARRNVIKVKGKAAVKGKDIDHIVPLSRGGSNNMSNLRITSVKQNRSRNLKSKKSSWVSEFAFYLISVLVAVLVFDIYVVVTLLGN